MHDVVCTKCHFDLVYTFWKRVNLQFSLGGDKKTTLQFAKV